MKQRTIVVAAGPNILSQNDGPKGAGFIGIHIPSHEHPQALFGIPVANIPAELIEPMLQVGTEAYADVDFDPLPGDPNLAAIYGFYLENAPAPVSVTNLEIRKPN